jgi:hypothetical protein
MSPKKIYPLLVSVSRLVARKGKTQKIIAHNAGQEKGYSPSSFNQELFIIKNINFHVPRKKTLTFTESYN